MLRTRRALTLALALAFVSVSGLAACEPAPSTPAPTKRAKAVQVAKQQLGKPYSYGSAGPNSFDCSGLTSYSWKAAGITLPRTSRDQYPATNRISKAQLQPGDLVFWSSSKSASAISHVGMYIGNNQVIHARKTGYPVEIVSVDWWSTNRVGYGQIRGV